MAYIHIKANAYFTPKRPKHMDDYRDTNNPPSTEALWITAADVLEYIESTGLKKDVYIGLMGYEDLYITCTGEVFGVGGMEPIAKFAHCGANRRKFFIYIFEKAREIYLKSEISKDKNRLYQFNPEDTEMLVNKIFSHEKYNITCSKEK